MPKMKLCCLCFSPKTGTVILGCVGILLSVLTLIPHCVLIENHEFYIREYVKNQRINGGDIVFFFVALPFALLYPMGDTETLMGPFVLCQESSTNQD
jgi:hypothetical protein